MGEGKRIPQAPIDFIVVEVEQAIADKIKHGTLELELNPGFAKEGFDRAKYVCKSAKVVSVPLGMRACRQIVPEVKVGDTAHFHYNAISEYNRIPDTNYYRIRYSMVLAVVRMGDIIPIGGHILTTPLPSEGEKDIEEIEIEGKTLVIRKTGNLDGFGIIAELNPTRVSLKRAKVEYIGTPLTVEDDLGLKVGDVVLYEKDADFDNIGDEILGMTFFYMTAGELMAVETK